MASVRRSLRSIALLLISSLGSPATAAERVPILFDTDIGCDIDDAFALGLFFGSEEVELRGITTVGGNAQQRAMMVCRFLTMTGRRHTAVAAGADPQPDRPITSQYPYYYHPDALFDRTKKPEKQTAAEFLHARLKAQPGRITVVASGPLTNSARMLTDQPDSAGLIRRIILAESNVKLDLSAAKTVFASGIPLTVVTKEATADLRLDAAGVRRVFSPGTALSRQVQALYQLWDQEEPPLGDVLAATLAIDETVVKFGERDVYLDDQGNLRPSKGKGHRAVTAIDKDAFRKWYVDRTAALLPPERRPSSLVEPGGMPNRVHVAEDYNTDIERRWWMSGKAETKNLPPGGARACRGVLTHDFDDLLMASRQMYTAVIFNPVPGPPMGKNTRLSFRYWLKGTDSIRVQIYSLTNGYHRHLVVKGLPQERWQEATVDMTQARRPDGTGGPLSENERIDDIQFYVSPDAEILIDDIVLYDAASPEEKRPFPKQVHFTAGFDTGKQGKEWPGTFEIVQQKGSFWHAARSVENPQLGAPWIRLQLRGERALGEVTHLRFRYRVTGADGLRVRIVNSRTNDSHEAEVRELKKEEWAEVIVDLAAARLDRASAKRKTGDRIDEIHFLLPKGAELLLDDLLLFEPGEGK